MVKERVDNLAGNRHGGLGARPGWHVLRWKDRSSSRELWWMAAISGAKLIVKA